LLAIILKQEIVKTTEFALFPDIGEIGRRAYCVDLHKVLVIFFVRLVRFAYEAEPDPPLVEEK
jgi:hypothetical protein